MKRIRLHNTEFEGLNDVYVHADGGETVLVDAGAALDTVRQDLRDGLASVDLTVGDVDHVLLTHWHYDHTGLAGEVQSESGATVHAHEADAPLIAGDEDSLFEERRQQREKLESWGVPDEPRDELAAFTERHADLAGDPVDVAPFESGETLSVGGVDFEAVHLPGHAAGLTAFAVDDGSALAAGVGDDASDLGPDDSAAFVGDAILPKYTPNVGGADVRVDGPLANYVESLVEVVDRDWTVAYPGHRDPIDDPAGRAATILDHHRDRTRRVIDTLADHGPLTPWDVSAHLFGDLDGIHILHGPGEAYAHLDHLTSHGVVERDGRAYALVDGDPSVTGLFPDLGIDRVVEWDGE